MNVKITEPIIMVLISFGFFGSSLEAVAQGTPLACQVEKAGGLFWEKSMWRTSSFEERKFILVLEGGNLQQESASKAMRNAPTTCVKVYGKNISCTTEHGLYLYFNPETMHGTIGTLNTENNPNKRDTVSVEAFVCQRF